MKKSAYFGIPYFLWIVLFVITPLVMVFYQSFHSIGGAFTFKHYAQYLGSGTYLRMTLNSIIYAFLITLITFLIAYPTAYVMARSKHADLWLLLIILPTWINLLLKAYAFIGIFSKTGAVNSFLQFFGLGPFQILFTDASFILVSAYIELPFMIIPIYNALAEMDGSLIEASRDLGANKMQTLIQVIFPLSLPGVKSGIQTVFIPSLSLFMLTRLIGGNKVITLGTAIEQHFMVTQNWGMGSTIGVVLTLLMFALLALMRKGEKHVR